MSSVKISAMTAASTLDGTESIPVVQSSGNRKATASQVKTYVRKNVSTAVTSSSGTLTLNASLGDYFTVTLTENVTTLAFSNLPGAGYGTTIMLQITQHASSPKTFTFPASFKWAGGSAGTISATNSAVDVLAITTFDNGTTWRATLANGFA
jgi:Iap family predicted aminopeptidase